VHTTVVALALPLAIGLSVDRVEGQTPPWSAQVAIEVVGDTNHLFARYAEKLLQVEGVRITDVDTAAQWSIEIAVMPLKSGDVVAGYTISEVILQRVNTAQVLFLLAATEPESSAARLALTRAAAVVISPSWLVARHVLLISLAADLPATIDRLAAAFDTDQLEDSRKAWNQLRTPSTH